MSNFFLGADTTKSNQFQSLVEEELKQAGVQINGPNQYDLQVYNHNLYARLIRDGDLGLGESYMEGWWDCECLDELVARLIRSRQSNAVPLLSIKNLFKYARTWLCPLGSEARAFNIAKKHYDLDNHLYAAMLDKRMTYTCGLWNDSVDDLEGAQEAKLDLICKKLNLEPGMKVLDCGSGWGSFAGYAAERYGVEVTGVNVSVEQVNYAKQRYADLSVSFVLEDYRQHTGVYDRVVSIGMVEHVGPHYYRAFIEKMRSCLKDDGMFLLHSIGNNHSNFRQDWIVKYIFPEGFVPSLTHLSFAVENQFVIEDVQNLSVNYDKTLMAWFDNFSQSWPNLSDKYGEKFYRMWTFYLLNCAGMFRARELQVYQLLLSPYGLEHGYKR